MASFWQALPGQPDDRQPLRAARDAREPRQADCAARRAARVRCPCRDGALRLLAAHVRRGGLRLPVHLALRESRAATRWFAPRARRSSCATTPWTPAAATSDVSRGRCMRSGWRRGAGAPGRRVRGVELLPLADRACPPGATRSSRTRPPGPARLADTAPRRRARVLSGLRLRGSAHRHACAAGACCGRAEGLAIKTDVRAASTRAWGTARKVARKAVADLVRGCARVGCGSSTPPRSGATPSAPEWHTWTRGWVLSASGRPRLPRAVSAQMER
jgi:hypothetical protein